MATGIPLPDNNRSGLFEGLLAGHKRQDQQQQMQQQWQEHLRNAAIREQQEERLRQMQPYLIAEHERKAETHPLEMDALKAKIQSENERAKMWSKGGNQRVTAAIQEADALYDRDDPRHAAYILHKSHQQMPTDTQMQEDKEFRSTPEFEKIAPYMKDAVDMNGLPVASQQFYRKQMHEELGQIDKSKQVMHAISQAREITKDNPDLYRKAINIIADPDKSPGMIEKSLTALMPKKDVEAFTHAAKLYADILTKQAQLNNMSRSVYALKLQQQAKAQVKNPDETNEQIFKNIERDIAPSLDREKAILYAMKHNQYLPFTKKYDLGEGQEPNQVPSEAHLPTEIGMMKGIDEEGNEQDVHPSNKEDFIAAGGKIL